MLKVDTGDLGTCGQSTTRTREARRPFALRGLVAPDQMFLGFGTHAGASIVSRAMGYTSSLSLLCSPNSLFRDLERQRRLYSAKLTNKFTVVRPQGRSPCLTARSFLLFTQTAGPVCFNTPSKGPASLFFALIYRRSEVRLQTLTHLYVLLDSRGLITSLHLSSSVSRVTSLLMW